MDVEFNVWRQPLENSAAATTSSVMAMTGMRRQCE